MFTIFGHPANVFLPQITKNKSISFSKIRFFSGALKRNEHKTAVTTIFGQPVSHFENPLSNDTSIGNFVIYVASGIILDALWIKLLFKQYHFFCEMTIKYTFSFSSILKFTIPKMFL